MLNVREDYLFRLENNVLTRGKHIISGKIQYGGAVIVVGSGVSAVCPHISTNTVRHDGTYSSTIEQNTFPSTRGPA